MNKVILSRAIAILLLAGLLVSLINLNANQTVKVKGQQEGPNIFEADVPVRGTYLFAEDYTTEWDDNGDGEKEEHNLEAPLIVDLAAAGFKPGDLVLIRSWGLVRGACDSSWDLTWDGLGSLGGVFSSSDTLLWDRSQEDVVGQEGVGDPHYDPPHHPEERALEGYDQDDHQDHAVAIHGHPSLVGAGGEKSTQYPRTVQGRNGYKV